MKVRVHITLKPGVLDPQGRATHHTLENMGFDGVNDVRCGRMVDLDVEPSVNDDEIADMCRKLLANTVIENFEVVRLTQDAAAS